MSKSTPTLSAEQIARYLAKYKEFVALSDRAGVQRWIDSLTDAECAVVLAAVKQDREARNNSRN